MIAALKRVRTMAAAMTVSAVTLVLSATAAPRDITMSELYDFCRTPVFAEALRKAESFGWPRMSEAKLENWRASFLDYLGGPVEVSGWQRGEDGKSDALSFWIAHGANGHRACVYATHDGRALERALTETFGAPDMAEDSEISRSAIWTHDGAEISFMNVGTAAQVNISSRP